MATTAHRTQRSMAALAGVALLALLLGTLVYVLGRPAGTAALLPAALEQPLAKVPRQLVGFIGWLPSFVHAFAFSILTAWLLPWRPGAAAGACAGWAAVDTLAEAGQHPAVSAPLAAALRELAGGGHWVEPLARYFTRGVFDPADIGAGLAGSAVAFVALWRVLRATRRELGSGGAGALPTISVGSARAPLKPSAPQSR